MLERVLITLLVLGGLAACWQVWQFYKLRLVQSLQPAETGAGAPTLLYFCADYCAPCKFQQAPIIERLAAKLGEAVIIQSYDVTEHAELASRYRVMTVPTTVVLNAGGQVAHVNYGVTDQAKLEAQLL